MDLGLWVVKPDIHVVRACAMLDCLMDFARVLADPENYARKIETLFEVVEVCRALARHITPLPQSMGKAVREVDVVLMRASYRKMVDCYIATGQMGPRRRRHQRRRVVGKSMLFGKATQATYTLKAHSS
jgi:hypothetical protein